MARRKEASISRYGGIARVNVSNIGSCSVRPCHLVGERRQCAGAYALTYGSRATFSLGFTHRVHFGNCLCKCINITSNTFPTPFIYVV